MGYTRKAYNYVRKGYKKNWKTFRGYTDPVSKGVYDFSKRSIIKSMPFIKESLGLNTEVKYKEFERAQTIGRDGGIDIDIFEISDIAIGDNKDQMHGNSLRFKSLQLRGFMNGPPTITVQFRLMVIRWDDDTSPTIQDILEDYPSSGVGEDDINRFYRKGTNDCRVLYDKTCVLQSQADGNASQKQIRLMLNLKHKLKRSGSSNAFQSGRLYVVCLSNKTSSDRPTITYRTRLNYVDN